MNLWNNRSWTPMLLKEIYKPFNSKDYIYEIKFDGIRAIIYASPQTFKIVNRHNVDITPIYPELKKIQTLVKGKTIFDGEIIMMNNGVPSFENLQKRVHLKDKNKIKYHSLNNPVVFICFDILHNNKNLIDLPLIKRKELLSKFPDNDNFIKSIWIEEDGISLFNNIKKLNLEGIVAKEKKSLYYLNCRTDAWLKIKNIKKGTFIIGGYIENKNKFTISLLLGEKKNNKLHFVGKVTIGKKNDIYNKIIKLKKRTISPFINFKEKNMVYIVPNLKCKVNYLERTKNNHLRQPFI